MKKIILPIISIILILSIIFNCIVSFPVKALKQTTLYDEIGKKAVLDNKKSEYVSSDSGINFKESSSETNGKGIYTLSSTKDNKYPVYYYRGNVNDNNIIFANFCWKIVRTTETGGIKLIYNGTPTDGKCDEVMKSHIGAFGTFDNDYQILSSVGYMHDDKVEKSSVTIKEDTLFSNDVEYNNGKYTLINAEAGLKDNHHYTCLGTNTNCDKVYYIPLALYYSSSVYSIILTDGNKIEDIVSKSATKAVNKNNSTQKEEFDNWYKENLVSYTDNLEDTVWCNDRTISDLGNFDKNSKISSYLETIFSPYQRMQEGKPSLVCSNNNDQFTVSKENGNGALTYPIATITSDEAMLAGVSINASNSFLTTKDLFYYNTLSPSKFRNNLTSMITVYQNKIEDMYIAGSTYRVPAVSLNHNIVLTSGDGTSNNPYQVKQGHKVTIKAEEALQKYFAEIEETTYLEGDEVTLNNLKNGQIIDGYKFIGYETSDVTIDGNKKFIMPDKDVTITAKFEKEKETIKDKIQGAIKNPNTATFVGIVSIIFIISGIVFTVLKHNKVKRY